MTLPIWSSELIIQMTMTSVAMANTSEYHPAMKTLPRTFARSRSSFWSESIETPLGRDCDEKSVFVRMFEKTMETIAYMYNLVNISYTGNR